MFTEIFLYLSNISHCLSSHFKDFYLYILNVLNIVDLMSRLMLGRIFLNFIFTFDIEHFIITCHTVFIKSIKI